LAADEPERFVLGVFYGETRPPNFTFYAVIKTGGEATPLDDDSAYRPIRWRRLPHRAQPCGANHQDVAR
jgi:hypothetical protein